MNTLKIITSAGTTYVEPPLGPQLDFDIVALIVTDTNIIELNEVNAEAVANHLLSLVYLNKRKQDEKIDTLQDVK